MPGLRRQCRTGDARVAGVTFATADLASSQAIVVFDPAEASIKEIIAAIGKAGYEATKVD